MKRALVTGATGFIGQALCRRLLEEGTEVTAVSRGVGRQALPGARKINLDVTIATDLPLAAAPYDEIYHLAATVSFDPTKSAILRSVNAGGTGNLLNAAREWGAGRVVVVSSACTIGLSYDPGMVLDETSVPDQALLNRNAYMASKLEAEVMALEAARLGQDVVVVNPTTVYGAGDYSLNSGTLVLSVAKSKAVPVPPGGSNVTGVSDTVEGMLAAARKGLIGERYILGGCNLRFAEIIEAVIQAVGRRPILVPLPRAARPLMSLAARAVGTFTRSRFITPQIIEDLFSFKYYSGAKAMRELGFTPKQSFTDVLAEAWAFYRREGVA
ncbi:MAG: NAD-dependent epimerase/dehydratase family protein [Solidesulfovibrio sp.]